MAAEADTTTPVLQEPERSNALLAVPKKGRLFESVLAMLNGAGLQFHRPNRVDVATCTTLPLTIVFLPASDIPSYVGEGNVDIGITGRDVLLESREGDNVEHVLDLGFGKCRLCVQAPVADNVSDVSQLAGRRIVTSFPNLARQFFDALPGGESTKIRYVSGSVEAACGLGLADGVVDLVETGTTMRAAGLEVVADVMETETVLIKSKSLRHPEMCELITKRIKGYMTATKYQMIMYNVARSLLEEAVAITPGKRRPTISQLEGEDACAVSALVKKKDASAIMDRLEAAGATDILILDVQNSRM